MDTQMRKGIIDICILAVLLTGDSYGWQIIKEIEPAMQISESTLYPVLQRLVKGEMIESYEVAHNGRLRKYYKLRKLGKERLEEFADEQRQLEKVMEFIAEKIGGTK